MNSRRGNDFSSSTKLKLAQRAGYRCSFPNCSKSTVGPVLSNTDGVHIVGRACHIEAAASGGPRYNRDMNPEQRRSIDNGIWCCNIHADMIDRDFNTFSVATLHEWKKIAELSAYELIDSSQHLVQRPNTLVQLSDKIVFRGIWHGMNIESRMIAFEIENFIYGDCAKMDAFVQNYPNIKSTQKYVVVESSGYGRLLANVPVIAELAGRKIVTFTLLNRTEYSSPNSAADTRLVFTERGTDVDPITEDGWIKGKDAVIQSIQLLLGSNRGQWALDPDFGSYLFFYYRDHHRNHELLQRLIKLEISRMTSVPEGSGIFGSNDPAVPISSVMRVEGATIVGHSRNLLEIDLRLYFADNTYYANRIAVPASLDV